MIHLIRRLLDFSGKERNALIVSFIFSLLNAIFEMLPIIAILTVLSEMFSTVDGSAMIRRRLSLPSSGTPFFSCFHLVTAFHFLRKHQTNRLRLSPDLLPQSCGLKSLKYTKYSCAFQILA